MYALVSQYNPRYPKVSLPSAWKECIRELCRIEAIDVRPVSPARLQKKNAVQIQTVCGSLNYSDLNTVHAGASGWHGRHAVFGTEIAGWVMESDKQSQFKEGDLVVTRLLSVCGACNLCKEGRGRCTVLASQPRAAFQERVWVPEIAIRKVRPGISPLHAVALEFSASIAMDLLKRCLCLRPGETLLIAGANSAIGSCLTQMASRNGMRVLNILRSQEAASRCLRNGAEAVFVVSSSAELVELRERMRDAASTESVDAVVDFAADFYGPTCLALLKSAGTYLPVGQSGARQVHPAAVRPIASGEFQGSPYLFHDGSYDPQTLLDNRSVIPPIDSVYPYSKVRQACERAWWSQGKSGKVVIAFMDLQTCQTALQG
ncbi:MAG: alcohol dehydrogenase catalytic domain-containing protein [Acidobacteriia bacterium]|nr:alcohol dehydrogenase catalytic domain-containing protein [Terriglobia bacterium]